MTSLIYCTHNCYCSNSIQRVILSGISHYFVKLNFSKNIYVKTLCSKFYFHKNYVFTCVVIRVGQYYDIIVYRDIEVSQ